MDLNVKWKGHRWPVPIVSKDSYSLSTMTSSLIIRVQTFMSVPALTITKQIFKAILRK